MSDPIQTLTTHIVSALKSLLGTDLDYSSVLVRPTPDPKFGDYQCSAIISIAKQLKKNPREIATQLVEKLEVSEISEKPEIAGPGFINFRLKSSYISSQLKTCLQDAKLGVIPASPPRRIVVDFSSPNIAKEMHVGHLRTTIIGDCLSRILEFAGHHVIRDNHIGDWGTPIGKVLYAYKRFLDKDALAKNPVAELERLYKKSTQLSEEDPAVLEEARKELVKLQSGDSENLELWKTMLQVSYHFCEEIYRKLDVRFDHVLGESFYNPMLPDTVNELLKLGIGEPSEGAICVFFRDHPQFKNQPLMIRKSDGGYNYATTDLATVRYRLEHFKADEIVILTDARQQDHFKQVFMTAEKWGYMAQFRHVWFGSILGEDGKPLKTRSGEPVKLMDLLEEAENRARAVVDQSNPEWDEQTRAEIARVIGIGAVKYADLSQNRQTDYVFSWDKMLSLQGNTAPYLEYAYVRVRSIFRRAGLENMAVLPSEFQLKEPAEQELARHILKFNFTIQQVLEDYKPNFLCNYLYELSGKFSSFFEQCPVLKSEEPVRTERLALCELTARVLKQGLNLLGIPTIEKM